MCFQGQSGHDTLKFVGKGAWPGSHDPKFSTSLGKDMHDITLTISF